jgi:hypothetical protein
MKPTRSLFLCLFSATLMQPWAVSQRTAPVPAPIAASAPTAVPALVPFSGTALNAEGKPLTGEASVTLLIFKEEQGGEPLFTETQSAALDAGGHYKVQLGATLPNGIPLDLFTSGEARWLEVQIAGQAAQPRVLLVSVPYAIKAGDASTLGGLPASAYALAGNRPFSTTTASSLAATAITPNVTSNVTTTGGTVGFVPVFTGSTSVGNSILFQNTTANGIGVGGTPSSGTELDVFGKAVVRGIFNLSRAGNATSSTGYNSYPFIWNSSAYNSSSKTDVAPIFALEAEVAGNNTANPSATFNLLYGHNGGTPAESGLYFNSNGTIHFAPGQTFPGTGPGDITGVTAGTGLTGGGSSGNVTLKAAVPFVLSGSANGVIEGKDTGSGFGVYGMSATGFGVYGEGSSFGAAGVSSGNIGLYGSGPYAGVSSYGGTYGVLSTAYNTSGTADGVHTTGANGVYALSNRAGGNGVYAEADNSSGSDFAVWGVSSSGYAGFFSGNVHVNGTLSKSAGTFKIDHPLDPANKYLSHSFVESPDMMDIYNGIAQLDGNGRAVVELPSYFNALNKDYRYQLTAVGAPGPNLYIAKEIEGNRFSIAGGQAGSKVSWQVTGVRQDAYANAHRTPVEELKPGKERGTYLHPELFGQPREKGSEWAVHPEMLARRKTGIPSQK